jgi:hypothetical protein
MPVTGQKRTMRAHHGEVDALIARHADHVVELLHAVLSMGEPD